MTRSVFLLAAFALLPFSIASELPPEHSRAQTLGGCVTGKTNNNDKNGEGTGVCPASPLKAVMPIVARGAGLTARQRVTCIPSSYVPCPNDQKHCCPPGATCCKSNCCEEGKECCDDGCKLRGDKCCGNGWSCPEDTECCPKKGCRKAGGECCADGTSCPKGEKCLRVASEGPGGQYICRKPCPDPETVTVTKEPSKTATVTQTVVENEDSAQDGFSCPPMTVTNEAGDKLGRGVDCGLAFIPAASSTAPPTSTSDPKAEKRAMSDECPTVTTKTVTPSKGGTATSTVTEAPEELPEFSCPPSTVTNSAGDKLTLDDKCMMAIKLADGGNQTDTGGAPTMGMSLGMVSAAFCIGAAVLL